MPKRKMVTRKHMEDQLSEQRRNFSKVASAYQTEILHLKDKLRIYETRTTEPMEALVNALRTAVWAMRPNRQGDFR